VVYDPCNPVPGTNIPSGLPPVTHHKYAVHHVVGRIRHKLHHKYVHTGPTGGGAPNPYGCEKHAVAGPGAGKYAALPTSPFPAAPVSKLAALGGGAVAFGGLGGLIGGFTGGGGGSKNVITKTTLNPPGTNPVIPVVTPPVSVIVPPVTPTTPGTPVTGPGTPSNPTVPVPEPASIVIFMMAVVVALTARYMVTRRTARVGAVSV
jgi:hypothetical protein